MLFCQPEEREVLCVANHEASLHEPCLAKGVLPMCLSWENVFTLVVAKLHQHIVIGKPVMGLVGCLFVCSFTLDFVLKMLGGG